MKQRKRISVLNVPIDPLTMQESVDFLHERLEKQERSFVVTANAEIIMMCQSDADYQSIVAHTADLVLPDGAGTVWAGRKLGFEVPERVAGFDLFNQLLHLAAEQQYKVFFFGGSPGIAEAAASKAQALYPGVNIVGCRNGYFAEDESQAIIKEINESGAQLLFLALGAPKQEKWYARYAEQIDSSLAMGIGGSFDVLAGKMARAPLWMQKASLEWFFRLYKQPSRLGRMMVLPQFVIRVLCNK